MKNVRVLYSTSLIPIRFITDITILACVSICHVEMTCGSAAHYDMMYTCHVARCDRIVCRQ